MQKKLVATLDELDLDTLYQLMAQDELRETEALAWAEATLGDVAEEPGNIVPRVSLIESDRFGQ